MNNSFKFVIALFCAVMLGGVSYAQEDASHSSQWFCLECEDEILSYEYALGRDYFSWVSIEKVLADPNVLLRTLWCRGDKDFLTHGVEGETYFKFDDKKGRLYQKIIGKDYVRSKYGKPAIVLGEEKIYYGKIEFDKLAVATMSELKSDINAVIKRMKINYTPIDADGAKTLRDNLKMMRIDNVSFKFKDDRYPIPESWQRFTVESIVARGKEAVEVLKGGNVRFETVGNGNVAIQMPYSRVEEVPKDLLSYSDGYYKFKYRTRELGRLMSPDADYAQPFQSCINGPINDFTIRISPNKWVIDEKNQIQTACRHDENGHPIRPILEEDTPKLGTYSTEYHVFGYEAPAVVTCSRKMYQTPRTNKRTSGGGRYVHALLGSDGDPFAPWRVVQNRHYEVNVKQVAANTAIPLNVLAMLDLANDCSYYTIPKLEKYAMKAALYKTYKLANTATLRSDMLKAAKNLESKGNYIYAIWMYYVLGDDDNVARLCDKAFLACDNPTSLFETFISITNILCPVGLNYDKRGWGAYAFAGVKRFDVDALHPRSFVNKINPEAETKYFKEFWAKRDAYLIGFDSLSEFDEKLASEYVRYLASSIEDAQDKVEYCNLMLECPNNELAAKIKEYRDALIACEIYDIKSNFEDTITVEQLRTLDVQLGKVEKWIRETKHPISAHFERLDIDLDVLKLRAKINYLKRLFKI